MWIIFRDEHECLSACFGRRYSLNRSLIVYLLFMKFTCTEIHYVTVECALWSHTEDQNTSKLRSLNRFRLRAGWDVPPTRTPNRLPLEMFLPTSRMSKPSAASICRQTVTRAVCLLLPSTCCVSSPPAPLHSGATLPAAFQQNKRHKPH